MNFNYFAAKAAQGKFKDQNGLDEQQYNMSDDTSFYDSQDEPTQGNIPYDSSSPLHQGNTFDPNFQFGGNYPLPDPNLPPPNPNPSTSMGGEFFSNPLVSAAALSYGQQLVDTGKEFVDREFEKYIPISKIKYYFAVDTNYVYKKLGLIFFPFAHMDWSVKYASNQPVQPRHEINAPDLYIPSMAYLTYIIVAALALGIQKRFTPETLWIHASSALAYTILEILVHLISLYVADVSTSLTTIDILAFCGYKFLGIIFAVLASLFFQRSGYYVSLICFSISLSYFLIRTLKIKILPQNATPGNPYSTQIQQAGGDKRRLYLLLFIVSVQPFLMWWMSYHLLPAL